jgi:tubulin polyglutamylase TTLL6/13
MHLTNYAINKGSAKFQFNESADRPNTGHKRTLTAVLAQLQTLGHDSSAIWQQICELVTKTLISVQPVLAHHYRSCQPENYSNNMCF